MAYISTARTTIMKNNLQAQDMKSMHFFREVLHYRLHYLQTTAWQMHTLYSSVIHTSIKIVRIIQLTVIVTCIDCQNQHIQHRKTE